MPFPCSPAAQARHDGLGIPVRKVPAGLAVLTGVHRTQGALTQDALRRAVETVGTADEPWRAAGPAAPVVHTDDTGWRVGGESAVRMAVETDAATGYQVRPRHRHEAVPEVMPADDIGVLPTDRGRRDAAQAVDDVRQQPCRAHLQRSRSAVLVTTTGRARAVGERWPGLRQDAWPRWYDDHDGTGPTSRPRPKACGKSSPISGATVP